VYCANIDYLSKKMLIMNEGDVQNQNLKFKSSHLNQGKCEQIKCKKLKFFWYINVYIEVASIIWIIKHIDYQPMKWWKWNQQIWVLTHKIIENNLGWNKIK